MVINELSANAATSTSCCTLTQKVKLGNTALPVGWRYSCPGCYR